MEVQVYKALLWMLTVAEMRYQQYLNDTPTTVVQGNRGAFKQAMNNLGTAFEDIEVPDGVAYAEVVADAKASLLPKAEVPKTKGDDAITDGTAELNQDGSRIDGSDVDAIPEEAEAESEAESEVDAEVDAESEVDAEVDAEAESNGAEISDTEIDLPETQDTPDESEAESESEAEAESEVDAEAESESEAEAESEVDAEAETEAETESEVDAESEKPE